ncbi:MAG: DNA/RNA non-specific endonuclease [Oscillospiraceae bacterium]|nr:DNA/RNA non-specific endonuclease [Oscillospiraceae bacterium]
MSKKIRWSVLALLVCLLLAGCETQLPQGPGQSGGLIDLPVGTPADETPTPSDAEDLVYTAESFPDYSGEPFVPINGNVPSFTEDELTTNSYEYYSELDGLGRCGVTEACIGVDLMPTEKRESISSVKPTGWVQAQYDFVDGKSLYNRCHLIGFQLAGENANKLNLITGTRYLNVDGMLPFENMVADYVKETENHVLYRVTPHFVGDELVARGVFMEGYSVEDKGESVCFYIYAYNVQPGVGIDYATGESWLDQSASDSSGEAAVYVLNTNSKKFHLPDCSGVASISDANRQKVRIAREDLIAQGYSACGTCKP